MPQVIQGEIAKDIVRGVGITCLIFAASIYLPIIGFFGSLLLALIILFYRSKLGRTNGVIIPVVVAITMIVIVGDLSLDIIFFIGSMFLGFALGEFFEKNFSVEKTTLYACGVVLSSYIVILIFYINSTNIELIPLISGYVDKSLKISIDLYRNMGIPEDNIHKILNSIESFQYMLVRIIPAVVVILTMLLTWTTLLIAKPIFKSKELHYPDFGPLNEWKSFEPLVWVAIGCGLMLILPVTTFKIIGLNCLIILMMTYFFHGIAIVSFFFGKKRFPKMLKIFLYSIIAMQHLLLLLVIGLGFFDLWLNFRRLGVDETN